MEKKITRKKAVAAVKQENIELSVEEAIVLVRRALAQIKYGTVEIKVSAGKPVWVDKFERERVG